MGYILVNNQIDAGFSGFFWLTCENKVSKILALK